MPASIAQACRLQETLGNQVEYTIYERDTDLGGVWLNSLWKGCGQFSVLNSLARDPFSTTESARVLNPEAVDIPIHLYCLYSELNPAFRSKWAGRDEVLACKSPFLRLSSFQSVESADGCRSCDTDWASISEQLSAREKDTVAGADLVPALEQNRIVDKRRIRQHFVFNTTFTASEWDSVAQHHVITLRRANGDEFTVHADVLISATGALNKPIIPNVPGRDKFKGEQWHSSKWREDLDFEGKKIAVIGNGSSGIQCIPYLSSLPGVQLTQL